MEQIENLKRTEYKNNDFSKVFRFFLYSTIGIIVFFVSIKINNQTYNIIDYFYNMIKTNFKRLIQIYILVLTTRGCLIPFTKEQQFNKLKKLYYIIRFLSLFILVNIFFDIDFEFIKSDYILSYIEHIVVKIAIIIPLSAIFITFLVDYGLMEFVDVYFGKVINKFFKVSGKTFINLLLFLCNDLFCGFFMLDILSKNEKYDNKDVITVFSCFSILSLKSMKSIISYLEYDIKTYKLVLIYLIISFVFVRLFPIKYKKGKRNKYKSYKKNKFKNAIKSASNCISDDQSLIKSILKNIEYALNITMKIIPNTIMILVIGHYISNNTHIIELASYGVYPIINLFKIIDTLEVSRISLIAFFDTIIALKSLNNNITEFSKLIISVILISSGINLSTGIIYIKNSSIQITNKEISMIYIKRFILNILVASCIYYIFVGYYNIN